MLHPASQIVEVPILEIEKAKSREPEERKEPRNFGAYSKSGICGMLVICSHGSVHVKSIQV